MSFAAALSLDAIDISGSHEDDNTFSLTHDGDIHKIRLSGSGKRLGEYITPKQQWGPFMMRRPQEVSQAFTAKSNTMLHIAPLLVKFS